MTLFNPPAPSSTLITSDTGNPINPLSMGPPHYVDLHVNAGECISLQSLDGQEQVFTGPATVTMISQQQNPPVPIPVQVPPGHMVHQIADENGALKHIILSVMVNDDSSQFNSSIINLPHGSFRINSLGEFVSVESDLVADKDSPNQPQDRAVSIAQATPSTNPDTAALTMHHLPQQQTYFANYDGCTAVNYDTTMVGYGPQHYNNPSTYDNMVASTYHYDAANPSSYKASPSMLSHQAPSILPMASAAGPYNFAYSGFSQIRSHQSASSMANVASPVLGKQTNNFHKNLVASNGHSSATTTTPFKTNDNDINITRSNRSDQQTTNHNNLSNINTPANVLRGQRNDTGIKRQHNIENSINDFNRYNSNLRQQSVQQTNHSNSVTNSAPNHHQHNSGRQAGIGNLGSATANPRSSWVRGNHHNNHSNQLMSSHGLRNNCINHHGIASNDLSASGKAQHTFTLSPNQMVKDSKNATNFAPPHSPNLRLSSHQKQQQVNQRTLSTNIGKNHSSGYLSEDLSPIGDHKVGSKKRMYKTHSNTRENQNSKHMPDIELESSENILKNAESFNTDESTISLSRNSRVKHKKNHKEQARQTNQKRQHSIDDSDKSSTGARSRSINEDVREERENISYSKANANPLEKKCSISQEDFRQDKTTKTTTDDNQIEGNRLSVASETSIKDKVDSAVNEHDATESSVGIVSSSNADVDEGGDTGTSEKIDGKKISEDLDSSPDAVDEIDGVQMSPAKVKVNKQQLIPTKPVSSSESSGSPKSECQARKKSKSLQSSPRLADTKDGQLHVSGNNSGYVQQDINMPSNEDILTVCSTVYSNEISSGSKNSGHLDVQISLQTSRSENDIQLLNSNALNAAKSTQTTPQKQPLFTSQASSDQNQFNELSHTIDNEQSVSKKLEAKRKTSNGKTEQQFRLNSLPQVRILNLSCVSVTSSSVCLRWSYIHSLAEKYGVHHHHHHHHGSKHHAVLHDHFVVESSNSKNLETNTLISPKVAYQGCAMTCRINQLVAEKVYHFRVRQTALVSSGYGENLAVSEILSVTLPGVQQANSGKKSQNACGKSTNTNGDNQSLTASGGLAPMNLTIVSSSNLTNRGNTSSQPNNAHQHNIKSSSPSSPNHHYHPIKLSSLVKQCRNKFVTKFGTIAQSTLSSCSDKKFAGMLIVLFTVVAMLLAMIIHIYIVAPDSE